MTKENKDCNILDCDYNFKGKCDPPQDANMKYCPRKKLQEKKLFE